MVLVAHVPRTTGFPPVSWARALAPLGAFGVEIFFVISGFLITGLLVDQEARDGRILLGRFYARRAGRILPAALTYLFMLAGLAALGQVVVGAGDLLASTFFVRNLTGHSELTGHYWSLSIEEQFYLVWPLGLLLTPPRWRIPVTAALCAFAPIWRHANILLFTAPAVNWFRADLRYDALLIGALLALIQRDERLRRRLDLLLRTPRWWLWVAVLVLAVSPFAPARTPGALTLVLKSVQLLATAAVIKALVEGWGRPVQRVFNAGPVVFIGRISYSLYLWQQLFDFPITQAWFQRFPTNLGLTFIMAWLSYRFVEQPGLRLRERLEQRAAHRARAGALLS